MSESGGATVSYDFRRVRRPRSTGIALEGRDQGGAETLKEGRPASSGRVPRVTRLLALAHRFAELLARGEVSSMAELARMGRVSRARLTQIIDLTLLAPDIQEEILALAPVEQGRDPATMRDVLVIVRSLAWSEQRPLWREALARRASQSGSVHRAR